MKLRFLFTKKKHIELCADACNRPEYRADAREEAFARSKNTGLNTICYPIPRRLFLL